MPANSKKAKPMAKKQNFEYLDEDECAAEPEEAPAVNKPRKRNSAKISCEEIESPVYESDSEENHLELVEAKGDNCENEMQNVLSSFGADISRSLAAKRKRIQSFTQASFKSTNRRYEEILKSQQNERKKLWEEFAKQNAAVYSQWENDHVKAKENADKIENFLRQQQKSLQQQNIVQSQRIKSLKQLNEQFSKSLADLEKCHQTQQANIQGELKKDMTVLQKKMLKNTQQEEISNVRKSLQSMLAQV